MSGRFFEQRYKIRFNEVDGVGMVYYPHFLHLCHAALEDFIDAETESGYAHMIRDHRIGVPTVSLQAEYPAPLRLGDTALVRMQLQDMGTSSATFAYQIFRVEDAVLCCQAEVKSVAVDLEQLRPVPLPDYLRRAFVQIGAPRSSNHG